MQAAMFTMEVTMDLEILAALAPGANIVVYFAPSDKQFHALHHAVYDRIHKPSVLSLSWSEPEPGIPAGSLHAMNHLLRVAAHLGITVCASSGDQGAKNGSQDGSPSVNFPPSSPFCLGCGGTTPRFIKRDDKLQVAHETVWNSVYLTIHGASGGGVSRVLPVPPWQRSAHVPLNPLGRPGRGVPDVAAVADPRFGCELLIAGRPYSSSGTSAVAPLWAALIARCSAALGRRCGHINPLLYKGASQSTNGLRPVIKGSNGAYKAGPGWNPCTGCGTPIGTELLRSLAEAHRV
jgi:kumamolisin